MWREDAFLATLPRRRYAWRQQQKARLTQMQTDAARNAAGLRQDLDRRPGSKLDYYHVEETVERVGQKA